MSDFQDQMVRRPRQTKFFDATTFHSVLTTTVAVDGDLASAAAFNAAATTRRYSAQDATAYLAEVSTFGVLGFLMNTDADAVRAFLQLPPDLDTSKPVYIRPVWTTASQTSADTVLWTILWEQFAAGAALSATVNNALDTAIAEDTVGTTTAYVLQKTAWGVINADQLAHGVLTVLSIAMTTKAVGLSEDIWLLGYELSYEAQKEINVGTTDALAAPAV